jgi:hypothetical protein
MEIVLIVLIANTLLQPILTYMINSRCVRIKCGCIEIDRELMPIENKNNTIIENDIENQK